MPKLLTTMVLFCSSSISLSATSLGGGFALPLLHVSGTQVQTAGRLGGELDLGKKPCVFFSWATSDAPVEAHVQCLWCCYLALVVTPP